MGLGPPVCPCQPTAPLKMWAQNSSPQGRAYISCFPGHETVAPTTLALPLRVKAGARPLVMLLGEPATGDQSVFHCPQSCSC